MPIAIYIPEGTSVDDVEKQVLSAVTHDIDFDFGSRMLNIICSDKDEEPIYRELELARIEKLSQI